VFKSDRVGDLIYFSPCLKSIKDNNMESIITLVCSKYNYQIAKNYKFVDKYIILDNNNFLFILIKYFKDFFLTKYNYLFQFDGKSKSYLICFCVRASIKSTICFIKNKNFFNFSYRVFRPRKILLKIFFNNFLFCEENYSSRNKVHYQTLYFDILEKLDFRIYNKKNLFSLDKSFENIYYSFFNKSINSEYFLFHFDEKWDRCKESDFINSILLLKKISTIGTVIITTGIKNFKFLKDLKNNFTTYGYNKDKFNLLEKKENVSVCVIESLPLNLLAYFIKNSKKNLSYHSGPIVHISPSFNREIIDLIPEKKNNEIDRWIPIVSSYRRINFEELNDDFINNFKI
jgi:ADP-heptose:LPS heptosyltransferase